ncbi:hypothetical protein R3P38DRAFT_1087963 [Favolaschia claudopus]|uniref:Uncharacterized protein n=1 Tax=Favolaschia claudopus TaxID=2862362 RepID=A0AAW0BE58_9AGAR
MPRTVSNRTIDDQFGDSVSGALPVYNPAPNWNEGASCSNCAIRPDPALAFNHTWRDNSQFPGGASVSLTLDFTGTAVWVFCIVPPITANAITNYNLSYSLDSGAHQGRFAFTPTSKTDFLYNVTAVSLSSLPNTAHTLSVATDDAANGSIFLFDYAVYTTEEDTAEHSSISAGTIAGSVLGGLVLVLLLVVLSIVFWKRRRQRLNTRRILPVVEPFSMAQSPVTPTFVTESTKFNSPTTLTSSPSELVHQLQQLLTTAITMERTGTSERSPQSPSSGILSNPPDVPPPVYQPRFE